MINTMTRSIISGFRSASFPALPVAPPEYPTRDKRSRIMYEIVSINQSIHLLFSIKFVAAFCKSIS
jgi:hypothetical protein